MAPDATAKPRVLIAGGGVAGVEALLALRPHAAAVDVTMLSPDPDFLYRPMTVEEPFSGQPAEQLELAPIVAAAESQLRRASLAAVRAEDRRVVLGDGSDLPFDRLLVAIGGRAVAPYTSALMFMGAGAPLSVDELLRRAGDGGRIAFIAPPGASWPLPVYELALMTWRAAKRARAKIEIEIATPDPEPLALFGPVGSAAVAELLAARGIVFHGGAEVTEDEDGALRLTPGGPHLDAAVAVSVPQLRGPGIDGLPADGAGFIPVDEHARVSGLSGVYAAGDGTDCPIKQGGIATQLADAAAEHIVAELCGGPEPRPFRPVLRAQLITGPDTLHLLRDLGDPADRGRASSDPLWSDSQKIAGRHLSAWLAAETDHTSPLLPGLDGGTEP